MTTGTWLTVPRQPHSTTSTTILARVCGSCVYIFSFFCEIWVVFLWVFAMKLKFVLHRFAVRKDIMLFAQDDKEDFLVKAMYLGV